MPTTEVDAAPEEQVQEETTKVKVAPVKNDVSGGVDIKQLLAAGAHFGHKTSRWHPKMAPFIFDKRGGSHIIDLVQTVERLNVALDFLAQTAAAGKQILFVGTKKQAQDIVKQLAIDTNMPYVTERWLGGMLTNWNTIGGRVKHLKELEARMASGELANKYSKLEVQRFQEEIDRMNVLYGGIKDMNARPGAMVVFDVITDVNAVREAHKVKVPIVAIVDTNADPSVANYPVPSNDDAIKTIQLIADYLSQAVSTGKTRIKQPVLDKVEKAEAASAEVKNAPTEGDKGEG